MKPVKQCGEIADPWSANRVPMQNGRHPSVDSHLPLERPVEHDEQKHDRVPDRQRDCVVEPRLVSCTETV
jgi:hypothetical protein